jgi:glycosyltransferase involved in cell wall biosynthesis
MADKLFIVNNGMKDLCGHYYETAISVADAARSFGLQPVLATHVTCQHGIVPNGLNHYPLFRTDHWITADPAPGPDMQGMRTDLHGWRSVQIDSVLDGSKSLTDYLLSRYEPAPSQFPLAQSPAHDPERRRTKAIAQALLPPFIYELLRWLYRQRHSVKEAARVIITSTAPPVLLEAMRTRYARLNGKAGYGVHDRHRHRPLTPAIIVEKHLGQFPGCREVEYSDVFRRDLERLLCLAGFTPRDHVFLPTAHGRELFAIRQMIEAIGPQHLPTFHLEFRHALDYSAAECPSDDEHPYTAYHRIYFDGYRHYGPTPRVYLYTDTEELSAVYSHLAGVDFGVLPIPYRSRLMTPRGHVHQQPLTIMFFGEARDEKGFHLLPSVVESMWHEYVATGKVRFVFQATMVSRERYPKSAAALDRLKDYDPRHVELVALDNPLPAEDYYSLISRADILLSPSCRSAFRARSSGTLTEAIALGIPTIVPANTWLASQQPAGGGESYENETLLAQAVRRVCDGYNGYLTKAEAAREQWLQTHSPGRLVEALLARHADAERAA